MRVLIAIPHVFNPRGGGGYGSEGANPQPRISALTQSLQSLHALFGSQQVYFRYTDKLYSLPANHKHPVQIDVVVCTTQNLHILDRLPVPAGCYKHYPTQCEPMLLGFECHGVLKAGLGNYDYYGYIEDDIIIHDPLFFHKLSWFNSWVDNGWLLQPNRFEIASDDGVIAKNYIDPELLFHTGKPEENFAHYFTDNLTITAKVMGKEVIIRRAENPHSGCFFLNQQQMELWAGQKYFMDRDARFFGPLESAASLGIARTFRVYKPGIENANFLEIEHFGDAWSQKIHGTVFT